MRENVDQKDPEYGHILRSVYLKVYLQLKSKQRFKEHAKTFNE